MKLSIRPINYANHILMFCQLSFSSKKDCSNILQNEKKSKTLVSEQWIIKKRRTENKANNGRWPFMYFFNY